MLVSVTERTSESACARRWAQRKEHPGQFFWEGLLLTGVSGGLGIVASAGLMALLQAALTEDAGMGSATAGTLVGSAGDGGADVERDCGGALSRQ